MNHAEAARRSLENADGHIARIGGFRGNGADDLAPVATVEALIGIGHALLDISLWLAEIVGAIRQGQA